MKIMYKLLMSFICFFMFFSNVYALNVSADLHALDEGEDNKSDEVLVMVDPFGQVLANELGGTSENALGNNHVEIADDFVTDEEFNPNMGTLPSKYSLRSKMPVVRNQNPYGTCWTFAAVASAESSAINKGLTNTTVDLSELHIGYFFYNRKDGDDPLGLTNKDYNHAIGKNFLERGGNSVFTTFAVAGGMGYIDEPLMPYRNAASIANGASVNRSLAYQNNVLRINDVKWISMSNKDSIKQALMNYGALAVDYYHDDYYYNSSRYAYYYNGSAGTNHAVTLVGWDDNFAASNFKINPGKNGAWLIRNSWGSSWGDGGYFWISYADKSLNSGMAYQFDVTAPYHDEHIYQYDGSTNTGSLGYSSNVVRGANVYTATRDEALREVGFYAYNATDSYTITVYKNVGSSPTSGTKVASVSGKSSYKGYHTVKLPSSVTLKKGDKFSIVLKLTSPKSSTYTYLHVDDDYNNSWIKGDSYCTTKQSYIASASGSWQDLASIDSSKHDYVARIKAYTSSIPVSSIQLNKTTFTGYVGDTLSLSVTYSPSNAAYGKSVTWSTSNSSIARVSSSGVVSLVGTGTATIKATSVGGYTASCTVTVKPVIPITAVQLNTNNVTIYKGTTYQLTATIVPSNTTNSKTLTWSSANSSVASVSSNGLIKGEKLGTTTIAVTTVNGRKATCKVMVKELDSTIITNVAKASSSSLKLSWNQLNGVAGYEISRSTDNKKFSVVKTITKGTTTSYTNTKLKANKYYYYRIRSYILEDGKKVYSDYSPVEKVAILSTPSIKVKSESYNTLSISWSKISKADSYTIYRLNPGSDTYIEVATVKDLSYVDKNLSVGQTYKYKVRANSGISYGSNSSVKSGVPTLNTPSITAKSGNGYGNITLVWTSVSGAKSYEVYRSTSKDGKYTLQKELSSTSFTDVGDIGVTYYYKIRAKINNGSTYVSAFSSVVQAATVCDPIVSAVTYNYNTVKLNWTNISCAVEYEVYRSTSSSKNFKKVLTVPMAAGTIACLDTGLTTGKTYYYKVKTVTYNSQGKKVTSPYSSVVKVVPTVETPAITLSSSSGAVIVSWDKIDGASGYKIYRATSLDGTYKEVKSVSSKTLSYKNTGLDTNTQYYYKVRAYRTVSKSNKYSSYSNIRSEYACPTKVSGLSVSSSTEYALKLKWKEVKNTMYYYIYRLNESTGNYVFINSVPSTQTEYTDGVVFNKEYSYKVAAVSTHNKKAYYGDMSSAVKGKTIVSVPKYRDIILDKINTVSYSFYQYSNVDGYEVQRKTGEKGKYSLIGSTSSGNLFKNTDPTNYASYLYTYYEPLKAGTTYYYRVRAYKYDSYGNKVYSKYTSEKKYTVAKTLKNIGGGYPKTISFINSSGNKNGSYMNVKSVSTSISNITSSTYNLNMTVNYSKLYLNNRSKNEYYVRFYTSSNSYYLYNVYFEGVQGTFKKNKFKVTFKNLPIQVISYMHEPNHSSNSGDEDICLGVLDNVIVEFDN